MFCPSLPSLLVVVLVLSSFKNWGRFQYGISVLTIPKVACGLSILQFLRTLSEVSFNAGVSTHDIDAPAFGIAVGVKNNSCAVMLCCCDFLR